MLYCLVLGIVASLSAAQLGAALLAVAGLGAAASPPGQLLQQSQIQLGYYCRLVLRSVADLR